MESIKLAQIDRFFCNFNIEKRVNKIFLGTNLCQGQKFQNKIKHTNSQL